MGQRNRMANQLVIGILIALCVVEASIGTTSSVAKPWCPDKCGNITIPYPFGIGPICSGHESYTITCDNSSNSSSRPFLTSINLEVLEISLNGTIRINNPVITKDCPNRANDDVSVNLYNSLFSFSKAYNRFTAMGCNNIAFFLRPDFTIGGCISSCNMWGANVTGANGCFGVMCCQTEIPPLLKHLNIYLTSIGDRSFTHCKRAFVVEQRWFNTFRNPYNLTDMHHVPAVLEWNTTRACTTFGAYDNTTERPVSLCGRSAFCSEGKLCKCLNGYEGNPYLPDGCQDVDECANRSLNRCAMMCTNTPGSYNCSCASGYYQSHKYDCHIMKTYGNRVWSLFVGTDAGVGLLFLVVAAWRLSRVIKKRKKDLLKQKLFKRNGGLLLQKQLSSGQCNVDKTRLFTSKELEKATDHYNKNRIIGQGGQGTVYKGMLTDGRIVAIKKSKIENEGKLEHFINEVVILSQINHRNVVKLHGCCLETEVPMLVYEFIPNGNLYEYIHEKNEEFPLTWKMRLQVAREIAAALYYLHSATSTPVYHRDIKSTNILLDEKYRAKVADFGTSRSIAVDQTHLTTRVQGTFGYLDPEYFRSSQFTEKSDVYSFGVVLVELLTGQKPITSTESNEVLSLASYFIISKKENHLFDILDPRVLKEGGKEEILEFANLAKRCLNMNGRKRPTMKEIAMELEVMKNITGD